MNTRPILACAIATLLGVPALHAQAPATPAPTTPPAATTTGATGATTTGVGATGTTPGAATAKPKPMSSAESKSIVDLLSVMQFHVRMAEVGRNKDKDDKEFAAYAGKNHKEITELFTPLMSAAQVGGVNPKALEAVATVSKADKADIDKLSKSKPEKWKQEYFELLAKNGKRNTRVAENAVKSIIDPQAKDLATKTAAAITRQATEAEAKLKESKEKK